MARQLGNSTGTEPFSGERGESTPLLHGIASGALLGEPGSPRMVEKLSRRLIRIRRERHAELVSIENEFGGRVGDLHRFYVVPDLQDVNPPDERDDPSLIASRQSAFGLFDEFLRRPVRTDDGNNCLFVLGDAGMGKTSLLVMLKYRHLTSFWPTADNCALMKLGPDSLDRIDAIGDPANTILLLDSLDEDPAAHDHPNGAEGRLLDLLPRISRFRRVVLSCRTQFFVETSPSLTIRPGHFMVGNHECSVKYLSLFDDRQVEGYLQKRYQGGKVQQLLGALFRTGDTHSLRTAREAALSMDDLRMRPLLLSHIDDFVGEGSHEAIDFTNSYTVYRRLVDVWIRRDAFKPKTLSCEEGWRVATALAVHFARNQQQRIGRSELQSIPDLDAIEQFRVESRSLLCRTGEQEWQFSHLTIQEFLLAHAVLEGEQDLSGIALSPVTVRFVLDGMRCLETLSIDFRGAVLANPLSPAAVLRLFYGIELDMVLCPPGEFWMGSPDDENGRNPSEGPQHRVRLTQPFWLGKCPVTQAQYEAVVGGNPSHFQGGSRPVEQVSWEDAMELCRRLNRTVGAFCTARFRLPTEAEWEYACRARTDSAFNDGSPCTKPSAKDPALDQLGWFDENSRRETHPVGAKQPNAWGLHDMHGNAWEWCADWYGRYDPEAQIDPVGPQVGEARVMRGGSYLYGAGGCRAACRVRFDPGYRLRYLGFRLVAGQPPDGGVFASGATGPAEEGADAPGSRDATSEAGQARGASRGGNRR